MRGYAFNRTADFETVREIKEKLCFTRWVLFYDQKYNRNINYVTKSYDLDADKKLAEETTTLVESYTLPDGRVIKVANERFEAPECMFQPHLVDVEQPGIAGKHFVFQNFDWRLIILLKYYRITIQYHSISCRWYKSWVIQTYCPIWW